MTMNKDLSLYIHIPFCARKCRYCDFTSFEVKPPRIGEYIKALRSEIADAGDMYADRCIKSIYIGGGTPSYIETGHIASVMDLVREVFVVEDDAEISIEVNPGSADKSKFEGYLDAGINRLSIGLQSFDDSELKTLGRIHTSADFVRTYNEAREAGFYNINVDIISSVPGQTLRSYDHTLRSVCELAPDHISAYSLQLEEGTYMYEHRDEYEWIDEDTDRDMYHMTKQILSEYGYERYEISNYAKPGFSCAHNIRYWTGGDYLGIGLGAASLMGDERLKNTEEFLAYLCGERCVQSIRLSHEDKMEEYMFLGLRMMSGVSVSRFEEKFGVSLGDVYGRQIEELTDNGLICLEEDRIYLSDRGIDISNYCLAKFII